MKVSIKKCFGLAALCIANAACADVQSAIKDLQAKVHQAQEAVKQQIVTVQSDQQMAGVQKGEKEFALAGASKNLDHLAVGLEKVLTAARHKGQDQLKAMLKDEIAWLALVTTNLEGWASRQNKSYGEGVMFVVGYLKEFLAELKNIAQ